MTSEAVLAAMLSLPPSYLDRAESAEQRAELYRPTATAIAATARNEYEAAALISLGWHETKWSRAVLEYRCHDLGRLACDRGRARGGWQIHTRWCPVSSVADEARCALRALRYGRAHCTNGWLGAFAATRGTTSCTSRDGADRVRVMRETLARLRRPVGGKP